MYDEIPGLNNIVPSDSISMNVWWGGFYARDINKDILLGIGAAKYTNYDRSTNTTYNMTLTLASVHLHNFLRQTNAASSCSFGQGNITATFYTKINCDLTRHLHDPHFIHIAYPDCAYPEIVSRALVQ